MKKFIAIFFVLALTVFSVSATENFIEFDFSIPIKTRQDYKKTSIGLGLSYRAMFNDLLGFYTAADFVMPMELKLGDVTTKKKDWGKDTKYLGFDFMAGIAIVPVRMEKFKLLVAPVVHFDMEFNNTKTALGSSGYQNMSLGAGGNAMAEFHFSEKFYISGGIGFYYDFLNWAKVTVLDVSSEWEKLNETTFFTFQPRFGIGTRF